MSNIGDELPGVSIIEDDHSNFTIGYKGQWLTGHFLTDAEARRFAVSMIQAGDTMPGDMFKDWCQDQYANHLRPAFKNRAVSDSPRRPGVQS